MTTRLAWVLNFDADDELASPSSYGSVTNAMRVRLDALVPRAASLLAPGDVVIAHGRALADASSYVGRAWCPTPSALKRMRDAGVNVPRAPSVDVLARVNHRRFCAELGQVLAGASFATSADDCARVLAARPSDESWLLKRAFGFAGRGRRKVTSGALGDDDLRWIDASIDLGGVQIEPLVAIDREFALHAALDADGALLLGAPTVQRCDAYGAWIATDLAMPGDLADDEIAALERETRGVAAALTIAGYFGPFGVDAYRWRDASGVLRFNARSEVNARYSMGYGVGVSRGLRVPRDSLGLRA